MEFFEQARIGDELKRAARIKGTSFAKLSRRLRIPYPRLLRLLNGQRQARTGEIEKVASALGLSPPEVLNPANPRESCDE